MSNGWIPGKLQGKNSHYNQGYVDVSRSLKCLNESKIIAYRSGWELTFMRWLEKSPEVICWASECIRIPYTMPGGSTHSYYPDFYLKLINGREVVVEIKPRTQTTPPKSANPPQAHTYIKNQCKWRAAKKFCEERNLEFIILTEKSIELIRNNVATLILNRGCPKNT